MQQSSVRVSHALQALAPFHARDIARRLPFPHHRFFELSTQRCHLLGLSLIGVDSLDIDITTLGAMRWTDAVKPLFEPPPIGLERLLSKMAMPMWAPEDYRRLWTLIACPHAVEYLMHATTLTPKQIAILHELPPLLRHDNIIRHLDRQSEAKVLAYGFSDETKAGRLLRAAKKIKKRSTFFRKVENIIVTGRKFTTAPEVDHPAITCVGTIEELQRVGLRFQNCLRWHAASASAGEEAFYVYEGDEPAVVMISSRGTGIYVIDQMSGMANAELSAGTKQIIRAAFARIGVGDWHEAKRRKAIDSCIRDLAYVTIDVAKSIDDCCDALFKRLAVADAPEVDFWPYWL